MKTLLLGQDAVGKLRGKPLMPLHLEQYVVQVLVQIITYESNSRSSQTARVPNKNVSKCFLCEFPDFVLPVLCSGVFVLVDPMHRFPHVKFQPGT